MRFLLRNWHLKLSAVLLATVLYTGLVFSGSFADTPFELPVEPTGQPPDSVVLSIAPSTVEVVYRAPNDAATDLVQASIQATVDLSGYDMERAAEPQSLPVTVEAGTDGIDIVSVEPRTVTVEIDRLDEKTVPVEVVTGELPDTIQADEPVVSAEEVQVTGPAAMVARVERALARVLVDESGLDINRPSVPLEAVDIDGQPVEGVELEPQTVSVDIDVQEVETNVTVPVRPNIEPGTPAAGFALESLSVEPSTVTLRGLPEVLADIGEVLTEPLSIDGVSSDQVFEAQLTLPDEVRLADGGEPIATVTATIVPSVSSRSFVVGVLCQGAGTNACLPQLDQLTVTLSGTGAALDALGAEDVTPFVDASGLGPGTHSLTPAVPALPDGVTLESIVPGAVPVVIEAPAVATPTPAPAP